MALVPTYVVMTAIVGAHSTACSNVTHDGIAPVSIVATATGTTMTPSGVTTVSVKDDTKKLSVGLMTS